MKNSCFFIHNFWKSVISIKFICKFIEITFWHGCSPVNLLQIFRTTFPKTTSRQLLLCLLLHTEKICWFSSYFKQGKGRNFCGILIKSQKLRLLKILNIGLTTKVNCHEFYFYYTNFTFFTFNFIFYFYTQFKMHTTPVSLKNYSFHNFLNRSNFAFVCFFPKKIFFISKNVYVMFMFTPWHLLERYIYHVCIFVDHFFRTQLVLAFLK